SCESGVWRKQPACFLAGQITGPLRLRSTGPARIFGVRFLPQGAGKALGFRMEGVRDSILPVSDFSPILARELDRAREFDSPMRQATCVEAALVRWKQLAGRDDSLIDDAIAQMELG